MSNDYKKLKTESGMASSPFSKNLMGLKFMQNARTRIEKTVEPEPTLSNLPNPGYQYCERLKLGRMSFKGMNTRIEALHEQLRESNEICP